MDDGRNTARTHRAPRPMEPEIDPASEFELFFELEHERLYAACYLVTGSRWVAEDTMQAAFLHTWDRWSRVSTMERPSLFTIRRAINAGWSPWWGLAILIPLLNLVAMVAFAMLPAAQADAELAEIHSAPTLLRPGEPLPSIRQKRVPGGSCRPR